MKSPRNFLLLFLAVGTVITLLSNSGGAIAEHTGAPSEQTCGRSSCHNLAPNQGGATIAIEFSDASDKYQANQTYTIQASIANADAPNRNGFQIVALDAQNKNVGEWILTDAANTQLEDGFTLRDRKYVTHTSSGNRQTSWSIDWKAPADNAGNITFYLAVIDANSNGSNRGDMLYTISKSVGFDQVSSTKNTQRESSLVLNNPVKQVIQWKTNEYFNSSYSIFNLKGQAVAQGIVHNNLDVSNLPNGFYFLNIHTKYGNVTEKIIIANQ